MFPSNVAKSIDQQARQMILYVREIRNQCENIIASIDQIGGRRLTGSFMVDTLNAMVFLRQNAQQTNSKQVRAKLLTDYPVEVVEPTPADIASPGYTNRSDFLNDQVQDQLVEIFQNHRSVMAELSDLIALVKASGDLITADDQNGKIEAIVTSPESDSLRTKADETRNLIADPSG